MPARLKTRRSKKIGRWKRPLLAYFRMPGSTSFGLLLLAFLLIVVAAVAELSVFYQNPLTHRRGLDTLEAVYAVFTLLVFETAYPLPGDALTRLVFFLVPFSGLVVLGQGIVRLGSAVLNREMWGRAMASTYEDHIIVCGLGRLGFRVVQWLLELGEEVVLIENRADNALLDQIRAWGVPTIIADARRSEILQQAGLMSAAAVVPITSNDLTNLSIAVEARRLCPGLKVVLRTFDDRLADNLETGFDIHTAFSTAALSAPAFAATATHAPVDYAFSFGEGDKRALLTVTKFTVVEGSKLIGYNMAQLEEEFDVAVIAHRSHGRFELHPPPDSTLAAGDGFIVSATLEGLNYLARITPPTREMRRYLEGRWPLDT
ncbi:MAG: potassium channel family protein [Anaerolineae bacterium]